MRKSHVLTVACATLLLVCTKLPTQTSGTVSETDTAMIYNPDNTPAVGAVVLFFVSTDSTRTVAYQTTTDANGRYFINKGLAKGTYNMLVYSAKGWAKSSSKMLSSGDSLIGYQEAISVLADTVLVQPDTLEIPGSITGIVGLQPNHDPRTATVQVLGTNIYSNVDANGRFTLAPVAKGSYNLRLVSTLPDYTPTYKTVYTQGQKKDTLADTLWLLYTGIPVVTGLSATYDTVNGVVHLSWNKATYRDFQDYLVFRDPFDSIVLSTNPIAARADTFFVDSIFKRSIGTGQFSFGDSNDYHFKYRVCIENNSTVRGQTYGNIAIVAASPTKATTSFAVTFFHLAKQFFTDSASINDSVRCTVRLNNPARQLRSLVWNDIATGKTVRTVVLDSTKKTASDSLVYLWSSLGTKGFECVTTDIAGTVWRDTATISIVKDAPVVSMTYLPATIAVNDTIHLHFSANRKYGKIVKIEWNVGNAGQFSAGAKVDTVIDTVLIAPGMPDSGYSCVVRVTDDDGNVVLDTVGIPISMFGIAADSAAFGSRAAHTSVVFNNKMWAIGGYDYTASNHNDAWYSSDGVSWTLASQNSACLMRQNHTSIVFNNKMWIIGGVSPSAGGILYNDIWSSSDGITWLQSTQAAQFTPRQSHSSVVFNSKMWVIGGVGSYPNSTLYNDVWCSTDGITWIQATANAGFLPRSGHSSVAYNNLMWVIGGSTRQTTGNPFSNDVWYSSDGVTWTQATSNAAFSKRAGHSSVVFDNKMWVLGGNDNSGYMKGDAWYSTDGVNWTEASSTAFSPRSGQTSVVFNNKMWVIGGILYDKITDYTDYSDVWYSTYGGK